MLCALLALACLAPRALAARESNQEPGPAMEVVFVLDTTGSMRNLINGAKQKIWDLANALTRAKPEPGLKFGLVAYRDRGDQYVTLVTGLSQDMDEVYEELLSYKARGGGDRPESVNQALHHAVTRIKWSRDPKVFKVIFLVGDAKPHMDYPDDVKYHKSCRAARERGIFINTVRCGPDPDTAVYWKDIARLGGGEFFSILQSGGMQIIKTPYDRQLAHLGRELDGTVTPYGQRALAKRAAQMSRAREIEAKAPAPALAGRAAFKTRAAGKSTLSAGRDLVSDYDEGKVLPKKLEKQKLPPEMRNMSSGELEELLQKKLEQRKKVRASIRELDQKRKQFIAGKMKEDKQKKPGGFDEVVVLAVRKQAAQKGIQINYGK